ncbi:MAG: rhodanese-like domain-containing protein [Campylobacterota bacterium]|nr:rhodanese-like domain-containing protein [Campylobacterota bacterium]
MKDRWVWIISLMLSMFMTVGLASSSNDWQSKASKKVKSLIQKGDLAVVDTAYIKSKLGKATRVNAKFILIDARPQKKYVGGHVPASYNLPDTKFKEYYSQFSNMDKNKEVVVYCGGWKCAKSPIVANLLQEKGFTNVKVYQEGMPQWKKQGNYIEVDLAIVKSAVKKNNAFIIDARPAKVYKKAHLPNAVNIPDTKFNDYLSILPKDKKTKIITYCGGYKCAKSHKVASALIDLGYSKVLVYAAGIPQWQKKGFEIQSNIKKVKKTQKSKEYIVVNAVQLVIEQEDNAGMVYGPFFLDVVDNKIPNMVLVDVRDAEDFQEGTIKGAVNIALEQLKPKEFIEEVNKILNDGKKVIFICSSGARSTEAMTLIQETGKNLDKVFFADANIDCDKKGVCSIEINDPI